jgi:hypothetical protein
MVLPEMAGTAFVRNPCAQEGLALPPRSRSIQILTLPFYSENKNISSSAYSKINRETVVMISTTAYQ